MERFASRFTDEVHHQPFFLPDLTLWFEWHQRESTLPAPTLAEITRQLGVCHWNERRPWAYETHRIDISVSQTPEEKKVTYRTPSGTLQSRWTLGPDGDFWQVEYPVKSTEDLLVLEDIADDRTYRLAGLPSGTGKDPPGVGLPRGARPQGSDADIAAVALPLSPFSMLVYEFLGLSEGLMLLWDETERIIEILRRFYNNLISFIADIANDPAPFVVLPDNLDGQFISPGNFRDHYMSTYRRISEMIHDQGKKLIIHAGGPVGSLLGDIGRSGVDGIEGVAGPPQGDTDLTSARKASGAGLTLWGGIPQDLLLASHDQSDFQRGVGEAFEQVVGQKRMVLGVADRVPPQASLDRLSAISRLIDERWG